MCLCEKIVNTRKSTKFYIDPEIEIFLIKKQIKVKHCNSITIYSFKDDKIFCRYNTKHTMLSKICLISEM